MNKRNLFVVGGTVALGMVLVALPSRSSTSEARATQEPSVELQEPMVAPDSRNLEFSFGEGSWLGVETGEVSGDKARELKLPAERGVMIGKVMPDSPASKAGLHENDVVTEINGQRVEGTSQFRRMIREIPAGRNVQMTVWRDGRAQTMAVTLGKSQDTQRIWKSATPGAFAFQVPDMPELPQLPRIEFDGMAMVQRPRIGIDAEDLNGQLGTFFGAPEGEGILVREVNSGSAAEKAGLKAGDVIVSLNGDRIRSVGDLRGKLAENGSDKPGSVKLGVLRNKSEMSVTVELPPITPRAARVIVHKTNI